MSLTTAELTSMRTTSDRELPDTCSISRRTSAPDGHGGSTVTWATVASAVACRVSPQTTRIQAEGELSSRVSNVTRWTITLPANTSLRTTDRIIVGARTFEVDTIADRSWELALRVECIEIG